MGHLLNSLLQGSTWQAALLNQTCKLKSWSHLCLCRAWTKVQDVFWELRAWLSLYPIETILNRFEGTLPYETHNVTPNRFHLRQKKETVQEQMHITQHKQWQGVHAQEYIWGCYRLWLLLVAPKLYPDSKRERARKVEAAFSKESQQQFFRQVK